MPFNTEALRRRRVLLNISQADLAIMAGVHLATISRIERDTLPNGGGMVGIDVTMRLAEALQMDVRDLLITPTGNRYESAVRFAQAAHSPVAMQRFYDDGDSIKSKAIRALTRPTPERTVAPGSVRVVNPPHVAPLLTAEQAQELLERRRAERAGDVPHPTMRAKLRIDPPENGVVAEPEEAEHHGAYMQEPGWEFERDPSSE